MTVTLWAAYYCGPRDSFRRFCFERGLIWEAFTKEVRFTGFSITGTGSLTGKPQRAGKRLMPSAY